ncbi:nucleotide-binding universal stress UspA family protein [Isoptericola jiangsuensis]|uniref:Nucleotide-binding universal stress UspA family protein n=1 Tax=Isoptericola jiangsuensis TaxID=548579 RepID=A0A2A9F2C4_9MICO|nr:universal stress protein [Isoptericola jiangsuensis]PFG44605.1 nucleotide-binding universal stress UspA family protein [Isoptericola jiangsuensis]
MDTRHAVVVGVDGSPASDQALDWAAAETVRRGSWLTVVSAYEMVTAPGPAAFGIGADELHRGAQANVWRALARMDGARERGCVVPDAADVTGEVVHGDPAGVLVDLSASSDLVVVGRHGYNVLDRLVLGSVSAAVSAQARGPVVVVPDDPIAAQSRCPADEVGPVWRVVAAVDFDDHLSRVLGQAFEEAHHAQVPLLVVHALDRDRAAVEHAYESAWVRGYRDEAVAALHDELVRWQDKYPRVTWSTVVERGRPVDLLTSTVQRRDLLVVGGRRHAPITGRILRSVADRVGRDAGCPVVVVHQQP